MMSSSQQSALPGLEAQKTVARICAAENALDAHRLFEESIHTLADWQIIFADERDVGSIKLLNQALGKDGFATSAFRGKSLWLMDAPFVAQSSPVAFMGGTAMFVDSNAASYIRAFTYRERISSDLISRAAEINRVGERLQHINPYLYLLECLRSWNEETEERSIQTVAAIRALSLPGSALSLEWAQHFRKRLREPAEEHARALVKAFVHDHHAGVFSGLVAQVELVEAALLRTQCIQLESNKSAAAKTEQLVAFMHDEIAGIMLRELIVCAGILARDPHSAISKKLNSIEEKEDPLGLIANCAWDMFIPRAMDALAAATPDQHPRLDFYVPELLCFDKDVSGILAATRLRALAIHRPTKAYFPFFDRDVREWLSDHIGAKRTRTISASLSEEGFIDRANRRHAVSVCSIIESDREKLLHLIQRRKNSK